jgi:hypothetical protein
MANRLKALCAISILALIVPASVDAALRMNGDVRPRHWKWAAQAQVNVPLPNVRIKLISGYDPEYFPIEREMYLPQPGWGGWTYKDEHILFLHELGHAFDTTELNSKQRNQFRALIGTRCVWWSTRCWNGKHTLPPGERFAEAYSACAIGLTREQLEERGYVSYGWHPHPSIESKLCDLIREVV